MNDSLVIFREKNHFFGLVTEDYDTRFSVDQCWINASDIAPSLWNFSREKAPDNGIFIQPKQQIPNKGIFVHLGALFGLPNIGFSFTGYLFLKEITDLRLDLPYQHFGILMDNYFNRISMKEVRQNRISINEFTDLPEEIPKSAFRYVYLFRKKKILIIDPLMLLRSYKDIFPANV